MGTKQKNEKEKPFEKMTVKELRAIALELSNITGVHGMNKVELISQIKQAKGIEDANISSSDTSVREIKVKIKSLKEKRVAALQAEDSKMATRLRRTISRLKKKTRSNAA